MDRSRLNGLRMPKLLQRFNEVHDSLGVATPVDLTDLARVAAMTDEDITFDQDNPATTEADWAGAVMKVGNKTVGRTI